MGLLASPSWGPGQFLEPLEVTDISQSTYKWFFCLSVSFFMRGKAKENEFRRDRSKPLRIIRLNNKFLIKKTEHEWRPTNGEWTSS